MKAWTPWEIVRHQVAVCGRVLDGRARPVAKAQVTLTAMPGAFKQRLKGAASAAGNRWEAPLERPDRTLSRADGIYYFLNLPAGPYTVKAIDPSSGAHAEKTVSVNRTSDGKMTIAVADLELTTA